MTDENDKGLDLSETGQPIGLIPRGNVRLTVSRFGKSVQMALHCSDEYAAIEVYERIVQSAKEGRLHLNLNTGNSD